MTTLREDSWWTLEKTVLEVRSRPNLGAVEGAEALSLPGNEKEETNRVSRI